MKHFVLILITFLLGCSLQAADKKHFVLYGVLLSQTEVRLAEGPHWVMDKGDTFPVEMFKDSQTKVVLRLAGTTFVTDKNNVKILEEKDITPEQLATYRNNVQNYLDSRAAKLKEDMQKQTTSQADPAK